MSAVTTQQYRPVSYLEDDTDDALSVRGIYDSAANVNNTKLYAISYKLRSVICQPYWYSEDADASENVTMIFAPVSVPSGLETLRWTIGHARSAGTTSVVWTLYCMTALYRGTATPIDTAKIATPYESDTITCSSGTHAVGHGSMDIARSALYNHVFLMLTSKNGDTSTRGYITSLDVTARP